MSPLPERVLLRMALFAAVAVAIELSCQIAFAYLGAGRRSDALQLLQWVLIHSAPGMAIVEFHEWAHITPLVVLGPTLATLCLRSYRLGLADAQRVLLVPRFPFFLRLLVLLGAIVAGRAVGGVAGSRVTEVVWFVACIAHVCTARVFERDARGPRRGRITGLLGAVPVLVVNQGDSRRIEVEPAPEAREASRPLIRSCPILREIE